MRRGGGGTSAGSWRLPAAWAGILVLAGLILIAAPVRPTFIYLMFVVMLAGAAATALTGLLGRERQRRWQVVAGLLGILPAVSLAVYLIFLSPTGSDHGLLTVTVGLLVLAWMMSTVLKLLSWKSIVNAVLGAVQCALLVTAVVMMRLPLTCQTGSKGPRHADRHSIPISMTPRPTRQRRIPACNPYPAPFPICLIPPAPVGILGTR
jgi:hypothetical protein